MKNIYDVIRQKELDLQQLQKEIEALRLASRLLADEGDSPAESLLAKSTATAAGVLPPPTRPQLMVTAKPAETSFTAPRDPGARQFP
jgi:hypothetical protein